MSASQAIRAAAELERRARARDGNRVGVLVRTNDGNGWRWRGERITDDAAAQVRRQFRGQLVIVNRSPAPLPATTADACFSVSA